MDGLILVSDKPLEGYEAFLADFLQKLRSERVEKLAVVAFMSGETLVGYHNMNLEDKQQAQAAIGRDVVDLIVRANFDRYMAEYERGEAGPDAE